MFRHVFHINQYFSKSVLFFFILFAFPMIYAQQNTNNLDRIYNHKIKSVRLYKYDSETDYPIMHLNDPGYFIISFDDLDAIPKDFSYKVIHCNASWEPSEELEQFDYIDGFQENRIFDVKNSFSTKVPYIHYEFKIPNDDIKLTKSGNYLLKVYKDIDESEIIFTRRFMIYDTKMKVVPEMRSSAMPPYTTSHQELKFSIQHTGIQVGNIENEIKVVVLQNGRWDKSVFNPTHTYNTNEEIIYNNIGSVLFKGLKEFRPLDIRSFKFRTLQVERLAEYRDGFELWLFEDKIRKYVPHVFTHDLNGKFFIEAHEQFDSKLEGEYANVNFYLKSLEPMSGNIYVTGAFNDFRIMENFKMKYNEESRSYQLNTLLKNGFYDYCYTYTDRENNYPDSEKIEGSSYETENDYLFLVYYRKFGGLYDELVAVEKLNTRPQ